MPAPYTPTGDAPSVRFSLGHVVATPGALDVVRSHGIDVLALVHRHARGARFWCCSSRAAVVWDAARETSVACVDENAAPPTPPPAVEERPRVAVDGDWPF